MPDIANATGAGVPIKIRGETVILGKLTIKDYGTVENHIAANRPDIIRKAAESTVGLSDDLAKLVIEAAVKRASTLGSVSPDEIVSFVDTIEGKAFTIWLMVEKNHPGKYKPEELLGLLEELSSSVDSQKQEELNRILKARDLASGSDGVIDSDASDESSSQKKTPKVKAKKHRPT